MYGAAVFIVAVGAAIFIRNYVKIDIESYAQPCPNDMAFLGNLGMQSNSQPNEREKCLASNIRNNMEHLTTQAWIRTGIFYGAFIIFCIILFLTLGCMSEAKIFRLDTGFGYIHVVTFFIAGLIILSFILGVFALYDLFSIWGYKD